MAEGPLWDARPDLLAFTAFPKQIWRRYLGLDVLSKSRTVTGTPTEQEDTPAALTA